MRFERRERERYGGSREGGFRERYGGGSGGRSFREVPVKVGEEYDVAITDIAAKGDGIARIEGFIVFVPHTVKGESCRIRVKEVARRFAVGEKVGAGAPAAESESKAVEEELPEEQSADSP